MTSQQLIQQQKDAMQGTIDEDEDDNDDGYFIDHPELEGFDFGITDMEVGVPDPFKAQEEIIRFN